MSLSSLSEKSFPLPARLATLLRESRWLLLVAVAVYLVLILYGYDRSDPAWSHSASGALTHNPGGVLGAWLADFMLYVFGLSAWWWVALLLQRVWSGYRYLSPDSLFDRRALWVALAGFAVLLLASSALEALRLHSLQAALPLAPGGMLGMLLGDGLAQVLGFTGATLFLLVLMATGFSLFSGLSWLRFTDRVGAALEEFYFWSLNAWYTWQDKRIGAQALSERKEVVEEEKRRVEDHEPIHIGQPQFEVRQSARVAAESQVPLFADMPDSLLPQLHLLDKPSHEVEVLSADTLEFTSRLIERKLQDFGVEVTVVAAYPGADYYPLRNRTCGRGKGQPDHQSGQRFGARAVGGQHSRGGNHSGQGLYGAGVAQSETADRETV